MLTPFYDFLFHMLAFEMSMQKCNSPMIECRLFFFFFSFLVGIFVNLICYSYEEWYKASCCWFCPWDRWTWKPKFSTSKWEASWPESRCFSCRAGKSLPWRSNSCGTRTTYKYCIGQILNSRQNVIFTLLQSNLPTYIWYRLCN